MRAVDKNTCNEEDCFNALLSGSPFWAAVIVRNSHRNPWKIGVKVCMMGGHVAIEVEVIKLDKRMQVGSQRSRPVH